MGFDETFVHCSAPSLCGIKPASLFSMRSECFASGRGKLCEWQRDFVKSRRYFVPIKKEGGRFLIFVFDWNLLEKVVSKSENEPYLLSKGYRLEKGFSGVLGELLHRLAFAADFPHEVGLFLGYPLCDVVGFERNRSAFKLSALWKVYGDLDEAERKIKLYKSCSDVCMKMLLSGLSVPAAARKYCSLHRRGAFKALGGRA